MLYRCNNPSCHNYKNYGGRGVIVCVEWNSFITFYNWAIIRWRRGLQLDKDKLGDGLLYSPKTCCFISCIENQNNKRGNKFIEYNGTTKTVSEWAIFLGFGRTIISKRLRQGWTIDKAFNTPIKQPTNK